MLRELFTRLCIGARSSITHGMKIMMFQRKVSWTGYKSMKDLPKLIDAICAAYDHPDYVPRDGKTFCNLAAHYVASKMGCYELDRKLANEITDYMSAAPSWQEVSMDDAQYTANRGSLVFAVQHGNPHGHICVVRPGQVKYSSKWGKMVPSVMNIGADNFIGKGVNYAFQEIPKFYGWKPSL